MQIVLYTIWVRATLNLSLFVKVLSLKLSVDLIHCMVLIVSENYFVKKASFRNKINTAVYEKLL